VLSHVAEPLHVCVPSIVKVQFAPASQVGVSPSHVWFCSSQVLFQHVGCASHVELPSHVFR
jgi:hypothetical protein